MDDHYMKSYEFTPYKLLFNYAQGKDVYVAQIISAFGFGIILSPWSMGIFFLIGWTIVYEIFIGFFLKFKSPYWYLPARIAVVLYSFMGWILGRIVVGFRHPFAETRPIYDQEIRNAQKSILANHRTGTYYFSKE